ncbi:hypothetical protein KY289_036371 [Solanum tuberosum]|nr:hypothetical protein KY289_036371 [Solanum tuberosum]
MQESWVLRVLRELKRGFVYLRDSTVGFTKEEHTGLGIRFGLLNSVFVMGLSKSQQFEITGRVRWLLVSVAALIGGGCLVGGRWRLPLSAVECRGNLELEETKSAKGKTKMKT